MKNATFWVFWVAESKNTLKRSPYSYRKMKVPAASKEWKELNSLLDNGKIYSCGYMSISMWKQWQADFGRYELSGDITEFI